MVIAREPARTCAAIANASRRLETKLPAVVVLE